MAVKSFNPVTPSRRHMATLDYASTITSTKPEKSLLKGKKASGGRNNAGRITTRFRGGGNKRRYRRSISSAPRKTFRPRSSRSSTIRTVRRISP